MTDGSVDRLRRGIYVGWDALLDLTIMALDPIFDASIAPTDRRIGVFGPYLEDGLLIIQNIMTYLTSKEYSSVTGIFYRRPGDDDFKRISGIMPPLIRDLIARSIPLHKWLHELPRLISKSVVYLMHVRGQGNEVEGCSDHGIPMLGFVLTDEITRERGVCNYLIDKETYTECICPEAELCDRIVEPFCPFYESVPVPWPIKKLFLNNTDRLIATRSLEDLKPIIDEFVR